MSGECIASESVQILMIRNLRRQHRFMHAQDSQGRHVIIKTVNGNTDEIKILKRLKDNVPLSSNPTEFSGVIPVLDILPYEENFFVITPRLVLVACIHLYTTNIFIGLSPKVG
jgi:hypothetical protein